MNASLAGTLYQPADLSYRFTLLNELLDLDELLEQGKIVEAREFIRQRLASQSEIPREDELDVRRHRVRNLAIAIFAGTLFGFGFVCTVADLMLRF